MKAKIPVELLSADNKTPLRTATDEISLCGCYIESMFTLDVGTKLTIILSLLEEKISVAAVVATKYPQVGNGIDFISMEEDARVKLQWFIAAQKQ